MVKVYCKFGSYKLYDFMVFSYKLMDGEFVMLEYCIFVYEVDKNVILCVEFICSVVVWFLMFVCFNFFEN